MEQLKPDAYFSASKQQRYALGIRMFEALVQEERDLVANCANTTAFLHELMGKHWTGFYFVRGNELVLGPFQGPVACTRIGYGKGVCGTAWMNKQTIIVPDVHQFEGHIACSSLSLSEIVIPLLDKNGSVVGVLDIDSAELNDFDHEDAIFLEHICSVLLKHTE